MRRNGNRSSWVTYETDEPRDTTTNCSFVSIPTRSRSFGASLMKPWGQPRLSLGQLLTLPFFVAAAMACIVPAVRSNAVRQYGLGPLLFLEGIIIPIALALVAQVLLSRDSGRDRVVAALLWLSALFGRIAILVLVAVTAWDLVVGILTGRGLPPDLLAFLIVLVGGLIALNEVALVLRHKISEVRCPRCGHPANTQAQREDSLGHRRNATCSICGATITIRPKESPPRNDPSPPTESRCSTLPAQPCGS